MFYRISRRDCWAKIIIEDYSSRLFYALSSFALVCGDNEVGAIVEPNNSFNRTDGV